MVQNTNFKELKKEVQIAVEFRNGMKAKVAEAEQEEKYPIPGKHWKGPLYGAPYTNPWIAAQDVYKLPGVRTKRKELINWFMAKKMDYYAKFIKGAIFSAIAGAWLFLVPMPLTAIAVPFTFLAGYYLMMSYHFKYKVYAGCRRYAVIKHIKVDDMYPPVFKPPFLIKRKFLWP